MYSSILDLSNRILALRDAVEIAQEDGDYAAGCEEALEGLEELETLLDRLASEVPIQGDDAGNPFDF